MISFEGVNQFCVRRLLWILTSEHKLNIVMIKLGVTSPVSVGSYSVLVLSHILHVLHNPDITACCCPPTDPCSHQPPVTDCMTRRDSRDSVTRDSPRHITAMLPSVLQTVCLTECGDVSSARCGHCTAQPGPAAAAAAAIRNKTGSGHQHRDSGATQCTVGTVGTLATEHEGP